MFEISTLKEKKITELQEIASNLGIEKITGLKKMDLAYKILDHSATNPEISEDKKLEIKESVKDVSIPIRKNRLKKLKQILKNPKKEILVKEAF